MFNNHKLRESNQQMKPLRGIFVAVLFLLLSGCAGHHLSLNTMSKDKAARISFDQDGYTKLFAKMRKLYGSIRRIEDEKGEIVFDRGFLKEMNPSKTVSVDLDEGIYALYADCQVKQTQGGHTIYKPAEWFRLKAGYEYKFGCGTYKTGQTRKGWSLFGGKFEHAKYGVQLVVTSIDPFDGSYDLAQTETTKEYKEAWRLANKSIQKTFNDWLDKRTDIIGDGVARFYSDDYVSGVGSSLSHWKAEQGSALDHSIKISVTPPKLKFSADLLTAEVSYLEHYRSDNTKDKKIKYMEYQKTDGQWKITRELIADARRR